MCVVAGMTARAAKRGRGNPLSSDLADQWHPSKNGDLRPEDFSAGSGQKVWWLCKDKPGCSKDCTQVHEWEARINNRSHGNGCPLCSSKGPNAHICLCRSVSAATFGFQWHPTRNGGVRPESVAACSGNKYWWLCDKWLWNKSDCAPDCTEVHEWESSANNRWKAGCPWCSGKSGLTCSCRSLSANARAVAIWHPTKNDNLRPEQVRAHSDRKVWLLCKNKEATCAPGCTNVHEWSAAAKDVSRGRGCPWCWSQPGFICPCRSVVVASFATEWHPSKNNIDPGSVSICSHKRVWWLCEQSHEWEATVKSRSEGNGCPICRVNKAEKKLRDHLGYSPHVRDFGKPSICCLDTFTQRHRQLVPDAVATLTCGKRIMVELDGPQHFEVVYWYDSQGSDLKDQLCRDLAKNRYARDDGVSLLRISYKEYDRVAEWLDRFIAAVEATDGQVFMISNPDLYREQKETGVKYGLV